MKVSENYTVFEDEEEKLNLLDDKYCVFDLTNIEIGLEMVRARPGDRVKLSIEIISENDEPDIR